MVGIDTRLQDLDGARVGVATGVAVGLASVVACIPAAMVASRLGVGASHTGWQRRGVSRRLKIS